MHIALPTCANLPAWEVDDAPLRAALASRGAVVHQPVWDDVRVDWARFDGVLVRTTWDYQEKLPAFWAWIERVAACAPLFNPPDVLRWSSHKGYLRQLGKRGVAIPPTEWLPPREPADIAALFRARGWARGFLKPMVGATARETLRFDADEASLSAAQAHADRLLPHEGLLLQEYLSSVEEVGELSLIFIDGALSHAVRKIPVPGDYRVQDDFGARDFPVWVTPEVETLGAHIVALATPTDEPLLYARVDFMTGPGGALLLGELELVEPSLFLRHAPEAGDRLAAALLTRLAA